MKHILASQLWSKVQSDEERRICIVEFAKALATHYQCVNFDFPKLSKVLGERRRITQTLGNLVSGEDGE